MTKDDHYTPVRNGDLYCSPACGRGCTYEEYELAVHKAEQLCAELGGGGFRPHVWENLGWHYSAQLGDADETRDSKCTIIVHITENPQHEERSAWFDVRVNGLQFEYTINLSDDGDGDTCARSVRQALAIVMSKLDTATSEMQSDTQRLLYEAGFAYGPRGVTSDGVVWRNRKTGRYVVQHVSHTHTGEHVNVKETDDINEASLIAYVHHSARLNGDYEPVHVEVFRKVSQRPQQSDKVASGILGAPIAAGDVPNMVVAILKLAGRVRSGEMVSGSDVLNEIQAAARADGVAP